MIDTKICERFQYWRKKHWNSGIDAAKAMKITQRHISEVESGKMEPTVHDIKMLMLLTDLNPYWMILNVGKEKRKNDEQKNLLTDMTDIKATLESLITKVKSIEKTNAVLRRKIFEIEQKEG